MVGGKGFFGEIQKIAGGNGIKAGRGFVKEQDVGLGQHGPGNGDALFLAGGIGHETKISLGGHVGKFKHLGDSSFFDGTLQIIEGGKEIKIISSRESPVKGAVIGADQPDLFPNQVRRLAGVQARDGGPSAVWSDESGQNLDNRGLAGAVRAKQPHDLPFTDRKGNISQGIDNARLPKEQASPVAFSERFGDVM